MTTTYRTQQIMIRPGHRLFSYVQDLCANAKNLANTMNFMIRQVYTAMKTVGPLHPLQNEALQTIHNHLDTINQAQQNAYGKRLLREQQKPPGQQKKASCTLFEAPTPAKPLLTYAFLDALFKAMKHPNYRALPAQASQAVMQGIGGDWKSFFAAIRAYSKNPAAFTGRPQMPKYCRSTYKTVTLTNQDCVVQGRFLKLPLTRTRLNIEKLGGATGKLKSVRIVPNHGYFTVELIMEEADPTASIWNTRRMGIDLGVDNLATLVTNTGKAPVLIKGGHVKAINQWYNKQKAHLMGVLRQGKNSKQGPFTSKKLAQLHARRHRTIRDIFHKASRHIVQIAQQDQISTLVIGYNDHWKQEASMGTRNNQSFCHIPHAQLVNLITYKANRMGIRVILQEESYTSQASLMDLDPIPVFDPNQRGTHTFSGKRIKRGLYSSRRGVQINADVNGAGNILRKTFPHENIQVVPAVSAKGIAGLDGQTVNVSTPLVLSVH